MFPFEFLEIVFLTISTMILKNYFDKSLSVSHINIRSLYKNFDSLQETILKFKFKGRFQY